MIHAEEYAPFIGRSLVRELDRAKLHASQGFYTEAALRLGRTVESGLYSIARELNIDLTNRYIKEISNLNDMLRSYEVNIIRKRGSEQVISLANVSKRLSQTIAKLAEQSEMRAGQLDDFARPNEQLFRELIQLIDDKKLNRQLRAQETLLREIQEYRNAAAHADINGEEREIDPETYGDFLIDVRKFLKALSDFIVHERARRVWGPVIDKQMKAAEESTKVEQGET